MQRTSAMNDPDTRIRWFSRWTAARSDTIASAMSIARSGRSQLARDAVSKPTPTVATAANDWAMITDRGTRMVRGCPIGCKQP